jgi:putative SOS response-associated peptidase YedK
VREFLSLVFDGIAEMPPSYNVAPTQTVPIVRLRESGERELAAVRWGLVPPWSKDPFRGPPLFNARSETAAEKPAFRSAFRHRRCLAPISGFYEWKKTGDSRQPYYITRADQSIMLLAGLWEHRPATHAAPALDSMTILTVPANAFMSQLHDRMPVILEPEQATAWLGHQTSPDILAGMLAPAPDGVLQAHPVSARVSSPKNDDPALCERIEPTGLFG